MGDDIGIGVASALIGGLLRGGQLVKGAGARALPYLRYADPRKVVPILQKAGPAARSVQQTLLRPSPVTQRIPVVNKLPTWAQNVLVPASPAGIAFGLLGMEGGAADPGITRPAPAVAPAATTPPATTPTPTTAPAPTAGPRVDASTTQALDSGYASAPAQSPRLEPVTPVRPPTFKLTPQGQFERYFGTPEFDYVFGAASRGEGAPATAEAMLELAKSLRAEKETPISTYYRAQSAAGRGQMGEIKKALGYEEGSDLAKWAEANPMLAQRLFAKKAQTPVVGTAD